MWLVSGPFDGIEKGEVNFKKTKLLKTGSRYTLGRKDRQLVVNHAKVSHDHGALTVGTYSQDDVSDPSVVPTLSIHNAGKKTMVLKRGEDSIIIAPSSTEDLQDGDIVDVITGVPLSVQWRQVCSLAPGKPSKALSIDACASLGINVVHTSHASVTHHLIPQFLANAAIATSLVAAAQFVKPDWLHEVIRLGNLPMGDDPSNGSSLEQVFTLPAETKFRPTFSTALPASLKVFKAWEPNEERVNMFVGYKFLFVGEKDREAEGAMADLVARGGGERAKFNVSTGRHDWHHLLAKEKQKQKTGNKKGLVIVADNKSMKIAIGSQQWDEFLEEARSFDAACVTPDTIIQAVLHIDVSLISTGPEVHVEDESGHRSSSPLPEFVPNTLPEEPSYPPPTDPSRPIRNLRRRVTPAPESRHATPPREVEPMEDEPPPPRKLLKRRARATTPAAIIGIDDPSVIDATADTAALLSVPSASTMDTTIPVMFTDDIAPIPARSSRLKRRAGTIASSVANTQTFQSGINRESEEEPPLKKFKALFDASHPDQKSSGQEFENAMSYDPPNSQLLTQSGSQTQSSATLGGRDTFDTRLGPVAEEEEESTLTQTRGFKRKSALEELDDAMGAGDAAGPPKRRALESVNAVQPHVSGIARKPPSSGPTKRTTLASGATVGKPDTDAAFLKAIASTKKGKKAEDSFDREFNKLKISKPDVQRDNQETEWAVLDDFEEDRGIRGNFMVVMEMEVYFKENGRESRDGTTRDEWPERPNFKKFKKKTNAGSRAKIELVIHEDNDYGMGAGYWKGNSQSQGEAQSQRKATQATQSTRRGRGFVTADSADVEEERALISKPAVSQAAHRRTQTARQMQPRGKSRPLFLDSDEDEKDELGSPIDDEVVIVDDEHDEDAMTLQSESTARQTRPKPAPVKKTARKTPVILDDDSDDGATFKGFRGKSRR